METNSDLYIEKIDDNKEALADFEDTLIASDNSSAKRKSNIILNYPTVYIHEWRGRSNNNDKYEAYIGESNDILKRTQQHYEAGSNEEAWQYQLCLDNSSKLYIIGCDHFNKSLTLDIENRLIEFMMSTEKIEKLHNSRGNPQNQYYPDKEFDGLFDKIWKELHDSDGNLFPTKDSIINSAIYKASPLHKLTSNQQTIKDTIIDKVITALPLKEDHQLIFVEGEAGTGKTILISSTFYELMTKIQTADETKQFDQSRKDKIKCCLIVNHDEQVKIYRQIMIKLGIINADDTDVVCKPTRFINNNKEVDVAFIDEAHLLLTQGSQSYKGTNQLEDIIKQAKVTVIMFDKNQILTTQQYWEQENLDKYKAIAQKNNNYFELTEQLRIRGNNDAMDWIDSFTKDLNVLNIPKMNNYEIYVFRKPEELEKSIKKKSEKCGLSRLIATYDWTFYKNKISDQNLNKVVIGSWEKPWNYVTANRLNENVNAKELSWAEQPQTINEIGSTFTIQGSDLNYAGVILGPSVTYKDGKVCFDASKKRYQRMTQYRTLSDGTKQKFGQELIQHEVRVLMTRGVKGLYIYACDENLRNALIEASKGHLQETSNGNAN